MGSFRSKADWVVTGSDLGFFEIFPEPPTINLETLISAWAAIRFQNINFSDSGVQTGG